jgi:hypothetical protein
MSAQVLDALHTPHAGVVIGVIAFLIVNLSLRSAWRDILGRWGAR